MYGNDITEVLSDPTGGDRHWIAQFNRIAAIQRKSSAEPTPRKIEIPISVIDMDTGKPVRPPQIYVVGKLDSFPKIVAGRYLVVKTEAAASAPMQLEIIDLQTGESQGFIPLSNAMADLVSLDNNHYAICSLIGTNASFTTRIDFYQLDSVTRTIQPDHSFPLDGITSAPMQWLRLHPPYRVGVTLSNETVHQQHQIIKTLLDWLARMGISRNNQSTISYQVYDLNHGQLLRQVTGIPTQGNPTTSHDWCSIVALTDYNEKLEPGLCLYRIPHYLWETTLSWLQWLAWLLVIPWPLRYYLPQPTRASAPSPSPSPDATADRPAA